MKIIFRIVLISLCLLGSPFLSEGRNMTDYCQLPSSIENPIDPNVLFAIDVSGSMGWCAYTGEFCNTVTYPYDGAPTGTTTYEGYFDPQKYYQLNVTDNVYYEYIPTGITCQQVPDETTRTCKGSTTSYYGCYKNTTECKNSSKPWWCATKQNRSGIAIRNTGNYLNYMHMRRIDILRWSLTGGKPEGCNNSIKSCDPEVYPDVQLTAVTVLVVFYWAPME